MKNILLIVLCLFLASCDDNAETKEERSERIAEQKELSRKCAENRYAYYQVDDVIFKLPTNSQVYARYEGGSAYHKCQTSLSKPLKADSLVFGVPFNLENNKGIFGFKVKLRSAKNQNFTRLEEVQRELASQGATIEDLELVDGFYKYIKPSKNPHIPENSRTQYIAADNALKSENGLPLLLSGCRTENSALTCSSLSELDQGVLMTTSPVLDFKHINSDMHISEWRKIYPQLIDNINSYRVSEER